MTLEVRGGAVRLDNADFARLLGAPDHPANAEALSVPGMPEGLAAVRNPLVEVDVLCSGAQALTRHHAWLSEQAALFLLTVREEERQVLVTSPAHLPSGVARVVRLHPEPVPDREPAAVTEGVLSDLFDEDSAARCAALDRTGAEAAWSATARWDEGERWVPVLRRADGLRLLDSYDEQWWQVPVSATEVWRLLTLLLPDADELVSATG